MQPITTYKQTYIYNSRNNCANTSFKAKCINDTFILKRTAQNAFKPIAVSFIEIEPTRINDVKAIDKVSQYWNDSYAVNMSYLANSIYNKRLSVNDFKIYALTKQQNDFKNLNASDILGLVEVTLKDKRNIHINYLQVDPEQVYAIKPDYSRIGSRILDSLKNLYDVITLKTNSKGVSKFYEKNGFLSIKEDSKTYIWIKLQGAFNKSK